MRKHVKYINARNYISSCLKHNKTTPVLIQNTGSTSYSYLIIQKMYEIKIKLSKQFFSQELEDRRDRVYIAGRIVEICEPIKIMKSPYEFL